MKEYAFKITEITTGVVKVIADNEEDAYDKAMCMDGDFFGHDTEVENIELLSVITL